jgi:hypothetical protein
MKFALATLALMLSLWAGSACNKTIPTLANKNVNVNVDAMSNTIKIKVGEKTFTATLLDNTAADAFKAMLPVTVSMTELNGNEKYYRMSQNLPSNSSNPGTINSGDLMLWGSNTVVLFYKTFSTSYSYTKLGKIDNAIGLAAALGSGNVTVRIEV